MSVVPLPADHSLGKSFEWGLDINLGTPGSPSWQPARRISAFAPTFPPATMDAQSYDDLGASNEEIIGRSVNISFTIQCNVSLTTGLFLPEVEALLHAARATGQAAVIEARWYHKPEVGAPNPNEAGQSLFTVEASRQNTGNSETEVYSVTLTGKGHFTPIENPFPGWDAVAPVVGGISPSGAEEGELVQIVGTGLLGATSVTFASTEAEFIVSNGATIIAQVPAGTAGPVAVTVTTAGGTSTAYTYERGA